MTWWYETSPLIIVMKKNPILNKFGSTLLAGWKDSNQVEDVGFTRQIFDIVQSALSLGGKTKRTFI